MVFRKNLRSLERRWEKISKFLGDLPSEQIFYRNIPLGAPDSSHRVDLIFNFIFNFNFIKVSQNNKHLQLGLVVI